MSGEESIPRYTIPNLGPIDAKKLYGGSRGGKNEPEFIENTGRDSMGHVFFTTGICWLGGFMGGGLYGSVEGMVIYIISIKLSDLYFIFILYSSFLNHKRLPGSNGHIQ